MTPDEYAEEQVASAAMKPIGAPILDDETTAGDSTEAGDVDPGATRSADETGQAGDPTEPAKDKAHPWNG